MEEIYDKCWHRFVRQDGMLLLFLAFLAAPRRARWGGVQGLTIPQELAIYGGKAVPDVVKCGLKASLQWGEGVFVMYM